MEDKIMKNILKAFVAGAMVLSAVSCADFLNRPSEDSYTLANYYQTDEQCIQGVNYLYCSPWYDCIRFYIYGSETMCGNVYQGQNAYTTLTVNGTDKDLKNLSYSLWAVNAHCNTVINNILGSEGPSQSVKNQCIGECLTWKAMAYFLLVRTFGDVPIIHDNTEIIKESAYNEVSKVQKADVYDYIVLTLEKALELLPKNPYIGQYNRIDYYAAKALLSKVYLTKAGVSGALSSGDLAAAKSYAEDVILNSGRSLTPKYSDVFRLSPSVYQQTGEALISWLWTSTSGIWTCQNSIQSDVGCTGFDEFGDLWGDWKGPSVDLQDDFGVSAADNPMNRVNTDDRRKATMMMAGDVYDYFWTTNGGFDYLRFFYDEDYGPSGTTNASDKSMNSPTGAGCVKFLYGDGNDHMAALGTSASRMAYGLSTHVLRLADIYLVYCEAKLHGPGSSTTDALALQCYNDIRNRAIPGDWSEKSVITFDEVFKERNLELALEGDRWYDYVRVGYYNPDYCVADIQAQRRNAYNSGLNDLYKAYYESGIWGDTSKITYNKDEFTPTADAIKTKLKALPFPSEDVVYNPHLEEDAQSFDLSTITF